MNPYELLKNDHEKVSKLFERIEAASGKAKRAAFTKLKAELDLHALIEEEILYPALKNADETRDITLESYEEHRVVKDLLAELAAADPSDKWDAKLTVLKENVEHHVDEEENDLFPKAKDVLSDEQAEALGDKMAAEKERQGAPVSDDLKKPSLLQRVVNTVFGGGSDDDSTEKNTTARATAKNTANASSRKAAKKSGAKKVSSKKSAAKKVSSKKSGAKKTGAKKALKKSAKKSAERKRTVTTARGKKAAKKSPAKARAKAA